MKSLFCLLLLLACVGCTHEKKVAHFIGRDPTWYGLDEDIDTTNLTAFTNALVEAIETEEDTILDIVDVGSPQLFAALEQKNVGAIFSTLQPTVITECSYRFSNPILQLGPVLVVRSNENVHSLDDLQNKIVAVNQFDNSILIAERIPSLIIEFYQNNAEALEKLYKGDYDGVLVSYLKAEALVDHFYRGELKIVTPPLNNKALRLMALKGKNDKLIDRFNEGLTSLSHNGSYQKLMKIFPVASIEKQQRVLK